MAVSNQTPDDPSVAPPQAAHGDHLSAWRRIAAGLAGGFAGAAVLSVIALVITAARRTPAGDRPLDIGAIITGYFVGGLLGGIIVGVLWPLVTTRTRARLVAILAAVPLAKVLSDVVNASGWFVVAGVAVIFGLIGSRYLWDAKTGAL